MKRTPAIAKSRAVRFAATIISRRSAGDFCFKTLAIAGSIVSMCRCVSLVMSSVSAFRRALYQSVLKIPSETTWFRPNNGVRSVVFLAGRTSLTITVANDVAFNRAVDMLLLIDNYDSFVHNLARYFERLGQETVVVRNDAVDVAAVRAMRPGAVVLSPGPCTPREAGASLAIIRELHAENPMLGVCLGHQAIAEALGGEVVRAPTPVHGQASWIQHGGTGLFQSIPSPLKVGRYHSLVVGPATLPSVLRATSRTDDEVLMSFEHVRFPVYGVQFHPESILTEHGYELLGNFLELAGLAKRSAARSFAARELSEPPMRPVMLPGRPVTF